MTVPARRRYDTESLLEVAVDVFTTRGYDGTSMEDLARASGLSKSSLYHHIDGKGSCSGSPSSGRWSRCSP